MRNIIKIINKILFIYYLGLLTLNLTGCTAWAPTKVVKKGTYYVRNRERDYQTSYFVPTLSVPEGLSQLDPNLEQICPKGALMDRSEVDIKPPGILIE